MAHRVKMWFWNGILDEIELYDRALSSAELDTILEADMGIVDVYWLRKTEVVDKKTELKAERAERISELEARFALIRQKLEE